MTVSPTAAAAASRAIARWCGVSMSAGPARFGYRAQIAVTTVRDAMRLHRPMLCYEGQWKHKHRQQTRHVFLSIRHSFLKQ